jgi:hypothetical protein
MALGKSIQFVRSFFEDEALRRNCNKLTKQDLLTTYGFTADEFDDALNMELVKCQTFEEVSRVEQLRMWFAIF